MLCGHACLESLRRIKDYVREHAKERKVAPLEWTE